MPNDRAADYLNSAIAGLDSGKLGVAVEWRLWWEGFECGTRSSCFAWGGII